MWNPYQPSAIQYFGIFSIFSMFDAVIFEFRRVKFPMDSTSPLQERFNVIEVYDNMSLCLFANLSQDIVLTRPLRKNIPFTEPEISPLTFPFMTL